MKTSNIIWTIIGLIILFIIGWVIYQNKKNATTSAVITNSTRRSTDTISLRKPISIWTGGLPCPDGYYRDPNNPDYCLLSSPVVEKIVVVRPELIRTTSGGKNVGSTIV